MYGENVRKKSVMNFQQLYTFLGLLSPKSGFKQLVLSLCGLNEIAKTTSKIYTNRVHQTRTGSRKYNSKIKLSSYMFLKKFSACFLPGYGRTKCGLTQNRDSR